jgi:hypothetical protein
VPKPDPALAKLAYFVGDWKLDAETKHNQSMAGKRFSSTSHNQWLAGGFFLIGESEESSGGSAGKTMTVFGYDPSAKAYTYYAFNSIGQIERAVGTLQGNVWIWTSEQKIENQVFRGRLTIETVSSTSYKFKSEIASGPTGWVTVLEGTATKTK